MPYGEVKLVPGVNVERTPTALQASISQSQLIRFRDSLTEKYGGWSRFDNGSISDGVTRDMHAWQDLNGVKYLLVGTTEELDFLDTSGNATTITPQQKTTNSPPNFTVTAFSNVVDITDPNVTNVTVYDSIMLNTPVAIGSINLSGPYKITAVTGANSYQVTTDNDPNQVLVSGTAAVPVFTTTAGSAVVNVGLTQNLLSVGDKIVFQVPTTGNGVTISGQYACNTTPNDGFNFTILVTTAANASGSFSMNGGLVQTVYTLTHLVNENSQAGTPITAIDWTSDNWGEIALFCPKGGAVYQFDPTMGFNTASLVTTAPPFNGGIFISTTLQILFCWGSSQKPPNTSAFRDGPGQFGIGIEQDPLLICWSDQGDYTNFITTTANQAGNFRIPIGSTIRCGMAVSNQNMFWTDLDAWVANYTGFPLVFGFNRIGIGAGAISSHAAQMLRGVVYWMGPTNFYSYSAEGVNVVASPVWDAVFQNMNQSFTQNVRAMPNTPFNEVGWLYPSANSLSGENDSYVKFNVTEPGKPWDYGLLDRTAWIDQNIIGPPMSASIDGGGGSIIYSQETTRDAAGSALVSSFTTGYFYIEEGQNFAFVDQIIPDFKWDYFGGSASATVLISFNVIDWPGDTPRTYGPYTMTSTTEYISVRFRGRQVSITVSSSDAGSFWRLGKVRYRWAAAGRR